MKQIVNDDRFGAPSNMLEHYIYNGITTWVRLDMKDTSKAHNFVRLQFDFYHAYRASDADSFLSRIQIRDSEDQQVARVQINPDSRTLSPEGSYTASTPQAFDLWLNNTNEVLTYQNPHNPADIRTLDPQNYDLYINGGLQVSNNNSGTWPTDANNITSVYIYGHESTQAQYFFDNFEMSAIPEPRTYALIFGLLVIGVTMILRCKRQ